MNMKTTILFALVSILLSSCAPQIYQVTQYEFTGHYPGTQANETSHDEITIRYNFWNEEGELGFTVINHSDAPVILDFSKSSLIVGGVNQSYITGEAPIEFRGKSRAPLLFWSKTAGTATIHHEQPTVFIAPQSEMYFQKLSIEIPVLEVPRSFAYDTTSLPLDEEMESRVIRHYLTFQVGEKQQVIKDSFKIISSRAIRSYTFYDINRSASSGTQLSSYHSMKESSNPTLGLASILVVGTAALITYTLLSEE